jgi:hypothetical protein
VLAALSLVRHADRVVYFENIDGQMLQALKIILVQQGVECLRVVNLGRIKGLLTNDAGLYELL